MPYIQNGKLYNTLEEKRESLLFFLKDRKDKRYRKGMLHAAIIFNVIDQDEWRFLTAQVDKRIIEPTIKL